MVPAQYIKQYDPSSGSEIFGQRHLWANKKSSRPRMASELKLWD